MEVYFEGLEPWRSIPTVCKGCDLHYGTFNVDRSSKCPRCAVYGTRIHPDDYETQGGYGG